MSERELKDAIGGLLAFVGQLTPQQMVEAIISMNPHMKGTRPQTRAVLEANLESATAKAWKCLADKVVPHGEG